MYNRGIIAVLFLFLIVNFSEAQHRGAQEASISRGVRFDGVFQTKVLGLGQNKEKGAWSAGLKMTSFSTDKREEFDLQKVRFGGTFMFGQQVWLDSSATDGKTKSLAGSFEIFYQTGQHLGAGVFASYQSIVGIVGVNNVFTPILGIGIALEQKHTIGIFVNLKHQFQASHFDVNTPSDTRIEAGITFHNIYKIGI